MEHNYFLKKNYLPLKETEKLNIKSWEENYKSTNKPLYFQYSVYKFARKIIKKKKIKSVLDIGCRDGRKLMKLLYPLINELYGIDLEKYFIDICRKRYGLNTFYHDDIENSDLELNKKFDLIISSDVIEHLLDPDKLIKYIKKYCTSKSFIIFSTPDRDILRGKNCHTSPSIGHIREWNSKEFKKYLIFSGFEIISHKIVLNVKLSFIIKTYIFDRKKKLKDNVNNFRLLLKILFLLNSKERKGVQSTQLTLCKIKP